MNRIIFFSGGLSSFAVAEWVKEKYSEDNIVLYFTDTCWEHPDLYRFNVEASDKLQLPLLTHSLGINPVQLMFEKRMVYNSMIGDCSKLLKQKVSADFLKKGIRPPVETWRNRERLKDEDFVKDAVLYYGIGFDEAHREPGIRKNWSSFQVEMPMIEFNIWKDVALKKYDIKQPALYDMGFSHNNCWGRCVKAGQGHWKLLKDRMPDVFKKTLEQEWHLWVVASSYRYIKSMDIPEDVRQILYDELDDAYRDYFYDRAVRPKTYVHPGFDDYKKVNRYAFMKRDGKPLTLRDFNLEIESDPQIDLLDIGGCGCFVSFE